MGLSKSRSGPADDTQNPRERWGRVEEIFHTALARPTKKRQDFVADACRGDESLRREVASLLAAVEGTEAFDEAAAARLAGNLMGDPRTPSSGRSSESLGSPSPLPRPERIGPYRLLEVLGEGGMGTVYLAEQSDPLPRRVALKLMRWGAAHGETVRRFELERYALARMSHPTIAQVFDAGATEHGQPYFVLEHIPGLPITRYCDTRRLDLKERLELLARVCDGVRHAHEKGVIHRDLKPSNILVSDSARGALPKIIDFGIAKALEPWSDTEATASRLLLGSPGYMSPEAVAAGGRAVDTRSDVYALGVVLSELLVGARPFEKSPSKNSRPTREPSAEPLRPSQRLRTLPPQARQTIARDRRLDEGRLVRRLRGELDWIVLRAVAPEPSERYRSVAELAADIERWIAGRPVTARPPSFAYRARKSVQRHAFAFLAAAVILATVIGFSIRSNVLYARAEASRIQAEELVGFMLDDLSTHLEPMGRLDLLESVSRKSLAYFESSGGNLDQAGRRPAAALRQIGRVLAIRGDLDAAFEAYERAWKLDRSRFEERPEDPSRRLDLAEDLKLLSRTHDARGETRLAESRLAEAETHLRRMIADSPRHIPARLALADTLVRQSAVLLGQQGDVEGAQACFSESLAMLEDLLRLRPDDPEVRHTLGDARYGIGMLKLYALADPAAALREFEAGIAVFKELAESQPEASLWRYRLAVLNGQGLATAYGQLERLAEAQDANRTALSLLEGLVFLEPGNGRWSHGLGWELIRQGQLAHSGGDLRAAALAYRRSIEVQEALVTRTTRVHADWLSGLATAYGALAEVRSEAGQDEEALQVAEASLRFRRRALGSGEGNVFHAADLALSGMRVAELRTRLGDAGGAREALAEVEEALGRIVGADLEDSSVRADIDRIQQWRQELLRSLDEGPAPDRR